MTAIVNEFLLISQLTRAREEAAEETENETEMDDERANENADEARLTEDLWETEVNQRRS